MPTLEITDNKSNEVIIRFIPYGDEHITIHKQDDGTLLRNHSSSNKPSSVWDNERVKIAGSLGYKNPQKHGQYIIHQPLHKFSNSQGYHLAGRRIDLEVLVKDKYKQKVDYKFEAPSKTFLLELIVSTPDNPSNNYQQKVPCLFGEICFGYSNSNPNI